MKAHVKKMKRQSTDCEKLFANHISDGLVSIIYEELSKLNSEKKYAIRKWPKDMTKYFAKKYM